MLMHVAGTTCETGRQDDQLANIGSISIIVHGIPEVNIVFDSEFLLVLSNESQPFCLNFGIHVHNKLVEEIFAMQDVIEITSSQHNPVGIKVHGRNVLFTWQSCCWVCLLQFNIISIITLPEN